MAQSLGVVPELQPAPCAAAKHLPIIASVPGSSRSAFTHVLPIWTQSFVTVLHVDTLMWKQDIEIYS